MLALSAGPWVARNDDIVVALAHARDKQMCLAATTKPGVRLLDRRVSSGKLVCTFPHLYEEPSYWRELPITERCMRVIRGAALLHPEWVFCDVSAAIMHGLQVSQAAWDVVHVVTSSKAHSRSTPNVIRHAINDPVVCSRHGVKVVDVDTCIKGCLGHLDFPYGLAVSDSYLRNNQLGRDELIDMVSMIGSHQRRCHALATARHADARSENGGESVARGTMIELGYQLPELQVEFGNPLDVTHPFRVDFFWPHACDGPPVIGELDGMDKYRNEEMLDGRTTVKALSDERIRESRLTMTGARVMRFHFGDVLDRVGFARLLDAFGVPKVDRSR